MLCLVGASTLVVGGYAQAKGDPSDPTQAVGRIRPTPQPMNFVGVARADEPAMRAHAERMWAVVLRNPALNPPVGFDIKPSLIAHGSPLPGKPARAPYTCTAGGYLHWYYFDQRLKRVEVTAVAIHAFYLHVNGLPVAFSGGTRWQSDEDGEMYWEPREIRRVGGYPQYDNGVIVITNGARPVWTPASRERLLRWELGTHRAALKANAEVSRSLVARDPEAEVDAWLRDRPKRQRDADELYEFTNRTNPRLAEENRAKLAKSEADTERTLRAGVAGQKRAVEIARSQVEAQRGKLEPCIRYLEQELARLSPAERAAPGYLAVGPPRPQPGCSSVVDASHRDARRIVVEDPGFFDPRLPRTAVQAILIDFTNFEKERGWRREVYERLREGLDYQALTAMLPRR